MLDRILETADAYERHLPKPASSLQLRMLEMGVQSGGSVRTWRKYYGNGLHYVGVDLNAGCRRSERAEEKTALFTAFGAMLSARGRIVLVLT